MPPQSPSALLGTLAAHLGVAPSGPSEISFERQGYPFVVTAPSNAMVRVSLQPGRHEGGYRDGTPPDDTSRNPFMDRGRPKLILRKKTEIDQLGTLWGIDRKFKTGDEAFDADVTIETQDPEAHVMAVIESDVVRRTVRKLFAGGSNWITVDGDSNTVLAPVRPGMDGMAFDPVHLEVVIDQLATIAGALAAFDGPRPKRKVHPIAWVGLTIVVLLAALPFLVWADSSAALVRTPDTMECYALGSLLTLPILAVLFLLLRRRSAALVAMLLTFPIIVVIGGLCGGSSLMIVNAKLDKGERQQHLTEVVSRHTETGDTNTTNVVTVRDWRNTRGTIEIGVGNGAYDRSLPGAKYRITTGAGRLGWEWRVGPAVLVEPRTH
jgi:hypothetical protein